MYYQSEVRTVKSSLPLNLGTIGFMCLPKHDSGESELTKFLSGRAYGRSQLRTHVGIKMKNPLKCFNFILYQ